MRDVAVIDGPFDPNEAMEAFARANRDGGAFVTFVGRVRSGAGVEALELTHYAPLTLAGIETLADRALAHWNLTGVLIRHRVGAMAPGEPIVLVSVAAAHRRDAYLANDFLMDHLKSTAWFWKREKRTGQWHWIDPRPEDAIDLARWDLVP